MCTDVTESSTSVVDLDQLEHPDDVKKDVFGRWNYSGSHVFHYRASSDMEFEKVSPGANRNWGDVFQLRHIHCRHPSNSQFQRLLAFITGITVIVPLVIVRLEVGHCSVMLVPDCSCIEQLGCFI